MNNNNPQVLKHRFLRNFSVLGLCPFEPLFFVLRGEERLPPLLMLSRREKSQVFAKISQDDFCDFLFFSLLSFLKFLRKKRGNLSSNSKGLFLPLALFLPYFSAIYAIFKRYFYHIYYCLFCPQDA